MEPEFLKERLERFLKIIPADYKIADPMKKSPKGWSTTLERVAATKIKKAIILPDEPKVARVKKDDAESKVSKKKSLDDLMDGGLM
jgi:hypothetical protein